MGGSRKWVKWSIRQSPSTLSPSQVVFFFFFISFYFGSAMWLAGSQFSNQGLNLGHGSEILES